MLSIPSNWMMPALLLLSIATGERLTVQAQQTANLAATDTASQPPVTDSEFTPTPEDIGDLMMVRQRYHEALDAYQKVPNPSPDVWNKMGMAYELMFDLKDAVQSFRKSLELRPDNANVLNNLATVYELQSKSSKAEDLYRKALKLDPKSARITMNLGTNLMAQRKFSEGSEMYKRALVLDADVLEDSDVSVPRPAPIRQRRSINYYKAIAYAQDGMNDRAIEYLQKAVKEGLTGLRKAATNGNFARLRGNPAFERLMSQEETKNSH